MVDTPQLRVSWYRSPETEPLYRELLAAPALADER
jgi:hypothetical protein